MQRIIFFLFVIYSPFAYSYEMSDSLYKKLNAVSHDSSKFDVYMELITNFRYSDPDSALALTQKALQIARRFESSEEKNRKKAGMTMKGETYSYMGVIYCDKSNYEKALECQYKALKVFEILENQKGIGMAYNDIGMVHRLQSNYPEALKNFQYFLDISEKIGFQQGIGQASNNIGMVHYHQGNYSKALKGYMKYLEISKQLGNTSDYIIASNNIGEIYHIKKDYQNAIKYYEDAIEKSVGTGSNKLLAYLLGNLGRLYQEKGDYKNALNIQIRSLQLREQFGDQQGIAIALGNISELNIRLQNYNKAEHYALRSLEIAENIGAQLRIKEAYGYLFRINDSLGHYKKAYHFHKLFKDMNDLLFNKDKHRQIAELETMYETEKKERAISLLNKEKTIQQAKLGRQRILLIAGAGGFILLVVASLLFYSRYRIKNRLNKQLQSVNAKLTESESNLKQLNYTKDRFFSILAHDLKSPLMSFRNITQSLSNNLRDISTEQIEHFINQAYYSAGKITELLNNLLHWSLVQTKRIGKNPRTFDANTIFAEAINLYKNQLDKKNITVENKLMHDSLVIADEHMISTVVRNLISNAIKFTLENGEMMIKSSSFDGDVIFSIKDNGIGLSDADQQKLFRIDVSNKDIGKSKNKGTGLGLILCKEFVEENEGKIWVESEEGKGSEFYFTLKSVT